jgi:DNA-binding XRE family transcriptional regulator
MGLSQSAMAREAGIARKTLWRIESNGEVRVIESVARSLSRTLQVEIEDLAPRAGSPAREDKLPAPPAE